MDRIPTPKRGLFSPKHVPAQPNSHTVVQPISQEMSRDPRDREDLGPRLVLLGRGDGDTLRRVHPASHRMGIPPEWASQSHPRRVLRTQHLRGGVLSLSDRLTQVLSHSLCCTCCGSIHSCLRSALFASFPKKSFDKRLEQNPRSNWFPVQVTPNWGGIPPMTSAGPIGPKAMNLNQEPPQKR